MSKIKVKGNDSFISDINGNEVFQFGKNSTAWINGKKYVNGVEVKHFPFFRFLLGMAVFLFIIYLIFK